MILPIGRRLGAIALVVAGVGAFLVPFLLHGPALQGTTTTTTPKTPGPTGCITNCQSSGGPPLHKKNLKDLMNSVSVCNNKDHPGWTRSLEAKIHAAMKADNSTRTDNNLVAFDHELNTPAATNHIGACLSDIKSVLAAITGS
jgi:hypothetical protein